MRVRVSYAESRTSGFTSSNMIPAATPDSTSLMSCVSSSVRVGQSLSCTITPRRSSLSIFADGSSFSLSSTAVGSVTFSTLSGVSQSFSVTVNVGSGVTTGPFSISNSISATSTSLSAYTVATASVLSCGSSTVPSGQSISCTVTPRIGTQTVYIRASDLTLSAGSTVGGSFSSLSPSGSSVANSFSFSYTTPASPFSGPISLSTSTGGLHSFTATLTPDASTLECNDGNEHISSGGETVCVIHPLVGGQSVYSARSSFSLSASGDGSGTLSTIQEVAGQALTFRFTAGSSASASGVVTLSDGVSGSFSLTILSSVDRVALTCSNTNVAVSTAVSCTLVPMVGEEVVTSSRTLFSLSDGAAVGSFSTLSPEVGSSFSFQYTADAVSRLVTLSELLVGAVSNPVLTVTKTPTSVSLTCSASDVGPSSSVSCTVEPRASSGAVYAPASSVPLTLTGGSGVSLSSLSSSILNSYSFSLSTSSLPATGISTISCVPFSASRTVTVWAVPDGGTLHCSESVVNVASQVSCTLLPTRSGQQIHARRSAFSLSLSPSGGGGVFSSLTPSIGNSFSFSFTAGSLTGPVAIDHGGPSSASNQFDLLLVDQPVSSSLSCEDDLIDVSSIVSCSISALTSEGEPMYARSNVFSVSALGGSGTFSPLSPLAASEFIFSFNPSATAQLTLVNGLGGSFDLTVVTTPDSTILSCARSQLATSSTTLCTLSSFYEGVSVFAPSSYFSLSASHGSVSGLASVADDVFEFTYTAPGTAGIGSITDGRGGSFEVTVVSIPDSTTFVCSKSFVMRSEAVDCTVTASSLSSSSSLTLSDGGAGGVFSSISPSTGTEFHFTYTASASALQPLSLSDGVTGSFAMTVVVTPTSSSISCSASRLLLSGSLSCTISVQAAHPSTQALVSVTSSPSSLSLSSSLGSFVLDGGQTNPSSTFAATFTAPSNTANTGTAVLGDSLSETFVTVYASPDEGRLTCASSVTQGGIVQCVVTSFLSGIAVHSLPSSLSLSIISADASAGTLHLMSSASNAARSFTFEFRTSSSFSGLVSLHSGLGAQTPSTTSDVHVTGVATISTVSCEGTDDVLINSVISCTTSVEDSLGPVWVSRASLSLSDQESGGSFSSLSPTYGSSFSFSYTAPSSSVAVSLSDGITAEPLTVLILAEPSDSLLACSQSVLAVGSTVTCSLYPLVDSASVYALPADFSLSSFGDAAGGDVFTSLSPTGPANEFTFNYTAGDNTGVVSLEDGLALPIDITVYAYPDEGVVSCAATSVRINQDVSCTVTAKLEGVSVLSLPSSLSVVDGGAGGVPTTLSPSTPSSSFSFSYHAPPTTGVVTLSTAAGGSLALPVTQAPSSSSLSCSFPVTQGTIAVGQSLPCTITPRNGAGQTTYSLVEDFSLTLNGGGSSDLSSLSPSTGGTLLSFTFSPQSSGVFVIRDGRGSSVTVTVTDSPSSATISCSAQELSVSSAVSCTLTPTKNGGAVFADSSSLSLSLDPSTAGSTSTLQPTGIASTFSFTFSSGSSEANVTVSSNVGGSLSLSIVSTATDVQTILTCDETATVNDVVVCTVAIQTSEGAPVDRPSSFLVPSVSGSASASTGTVSPSSGSHSSFTFSVSVGTNSASLSISDGVGSSSSLIVTRVPTSVFMECDLSILRAGEDATCLVVPNVVGEIDTYSDPLSFSLSVTGNPAGVSLSPLSPSSPATSFTTTLSIGAGATVSGSFSLTASVGSSSFAFVVVATPSSTSLSCNRDFIEASTETLVCSIDTGGVYTSSQGNTFTLGDGGKGGSFSTATPLYGSTFSFTYQSASSLSGVLTLTDGVTGSTDITVTDIPDSTTTVLGVGSLLLLQGSTKEFTVTPKKNDIQIYAAARHFQEEQWQIAGAASFGHGGLTVEEEYGDTLTVHFVTSSISTGICTLSLLGKLQYLFVYGIPDETSIVCRSETVASGGSGVVCDIKSYIDGQRIFARNSLFDISLSPNGLGSVGSISPSSAIALQFTYTPPTSGSGVVTISDNFGASDTITITTTPTRWELNCSASTIPVGGDVQCQAVPFVGNEAIYTVSTLLTPSLSGPVSLVKDNAFSTAANSFSFSVSSASEVTGEVLLGGSNGFSSVSLFVVDTPTRSTLACEHTYVELGESTNCSVSVFVVGREIHTSIDSLSLSASLAGSFSSLSPATPAHTFTFSFTPSEIGACTVSTGISEGSTSFQVVTAPSSTSVVCDSDVIDASTSVRCVFTPFDSQGVAVVTSSVYLSLSDSGSASGGSFGSVSPLVGSSFSVLYTAGTTPGEVTISDTEIGGGSTSLTVVTSPSSSSLSCPPSVDLGQTIICSVSALNGDGQVVSVRASSLELTLIGDGIVSSGLSPAFGDSFSFSYTATGTSTGSISLRTVGGVSVTVTRLGFPSSSQLVCGKSVVRRPSSVSCSVSPRDASGTTISMSRSHLNLSLSLSLPHGISFSLPEPSFGSLLTFTVSFAADTPTGNLVISDGIGGQFGLSVLESNPDALSLSCDSDGAMLPLLSYTTCHVTAFKQEVAVVVDSASILRSLSSFGTLSSTIRSEVEVGVPALSFNFTAPSSLTGETTLSVTSASDLSLSASLDLRVVGDPDSTSYLECEESFVRVGDSISCVYYAQVAGSPIHIDTSSISLTDTSGTNTSSFSPFDIEFGTDPAFSLIAGSLSHTSILQPSIGEGVTVTVIATPDSTSSISCVSSALALGSSTTCTVEARVGGTSVFSLFSDFDFSVTRGSLTLPAVSGPHESFSFKVVALELPTIVLEESVSQTLIPLTVLGMCLFVCLFICLFVCLFVFVFVFSPSLSLLSVYHRSSLFSLFFSPLSLPSLLLTPCSPLIQNPMLKLRSSPLWFSSTPSPVLTSFRLRTVTSSTSMTFPLALSISGRCFPLKVKH